MTDRGVSTVLDVSVCLLLVGAAVLTLLGASTPAPDPSAGRAEATATTLAATTATANYSAGDRQRTVYGTLAELLAAAARSNATPATGGEFRDTVANVTDPVLGGSGWRAQAVVDWRPYEGADRRAEFAVGDAPPPRVDVHAASMRVPSGLPPVREDARRAAEADGYHGVASVVAAAAADVLADSDGTRQRLRRRLVADLRAEYDSPMEAADAVRVGSVSITVRAWSP